MSEDLLVICTGCLETNWKLKIKNQPRDKDLIGSSSGQILKFRQFIFDLLPAVIDNWTETAGAVTSLRWLSAEVDDKHPIFACSDNYVKKLDPSVVDLRNLMASVWCLQ